MPLIPISSIDDPRLEHYRDLSRRNLTRQSGLFIAEGPKVAERLIESDYEVESLLAEPAYVERYQSQVPTDTPIFVVSRDILENTIGFNFHRGILACGRRKSPPSIADFLSKLPQPAAMFVACPDVQDPTNLGSIIRSTAAFGCDAILLGRQCADPFSRRVLRVSMGASLHLPVIESRNLAADLQTLATAGFELVAAMLDSAAEPLATARRGERMALLLGSEGHGLSCQWQELAHRKVTIPMQVGIDSLNVAIAAAVLLYHFCGQAKC
jgi:tRNA G18 (ribose-2'-O)-methylase SpoU